MGGLFQVKYIEELDTGECFEFNKDLYIVSTDYKKNRDRSCVNLSTGFVKWINASTIVQESPIYTLDEENNVIPLRKTNAK